ELVDKINNSTGVSASLNDAGKLVLSQENAVSITVADGNGTEALDAAGFDGAETHGNFRLVFTDTSSDGRGVKIEGADDTAATAGMMTAVAALGLDISDDQGNIQGATITDFASSLNAGDLIINGIAVGEVDAGADAGAKRDNLIEAINKISSLTGVVAFNGDAANSIALGSTTGDLSVKYGDNAAATLYAETGIQERNSAAGAGSVAGINISTAAGAQKAISIIDK